MTSEDSSSVHRFRAVSLIAALAGAVGSIALTLYAGRHNSSHLLAWLFTLWVLSPFVLLLGANLISQRWRASTRVTLYTAMLVVAVGSLAVYGEAALRPPRAQAAFVFVIVPPASLLFSAIIVAISAFRSGGPPRRGADVA